MAKKESSTYQIIEQNMKICCADPSIIPKEMEKYLSSEEEAEVLFTFVNENEKECCYGIQYLANGIKPIQNVFFSQKDKSQILYTFEENYSRFIMQINEECIEEVLSELLMIGFYSYISLQDTLLMHASAVCHQEKAIVFTASSGVGKTTQAELWAKYKGGTILNGDKVFLKREEDGIHAWGSPWKGSSPYGENASAPLRAIVVLEQAEENSIQKLEGLDVLEYVVPHVFFPCWDERCEQAVLTFLDEVLKETEIFLLKCRPDETAVELLAARLDEEKDH